MFDMLGDCFGRAAQRSGHGLILQPEQRDYLHFSRRELIEVSNPADSAMCVGTLIQAKPPELKTSYVEVIGEFRPWF
jgi:hypothetical protein